MAETPSADRLLAIIELQNAIAAAALNADEVMRVVAERAALLTSGAAATVELLEGDDVVCRAASGATQQLGQRKSSKHGLTGRSLHDRKPARSDDGTQVAVPLMHGEYAVGTLAVANPRSGAFSGEDLETLRLLANIIAIPLHRTRSFPRPRYDNTHDALTGLLNRRAFEERVNVELARRTRYGQSFSLALLDLVGQPLQPLPGLVQHRRCDALYAVGYQSQCRLLGHLLAAAAAGRCNGSAVYSP